MKGRIVIVDDEPITRLDLKEIIANAGFEVVGEAADGFEAIEVCKKMLPDVVLMDIEMPLLDGIRASKKIVQDNLAKSIIFLTAYASIDYTEKAKSAGASGYFVKPIDMKSLIPSLEMIIAKGNEKQELMEQISTLENKLEERKLIDKAKGYLIRKEGLSEEDAYNKLRKLSMKQRCKMSEIATIILLDDN